MNVLYGIGAAIFGLYIIINRNTVAASVEGMATGTKPSIAKKKFLINAVAVGVIFIVMGVRSVFGW
jgi:uncharacterized membrane protein